MKLNSFLVRRRSYFISLKGGTRNDFFNFHFLRGNIVAQHFARKILLALSNAMHPGELNATLGN